MLLPNLFVIGAPKAGTSSLHVYLDRHPAISMSRVKEPMLFTPADWRDRLAGYASLLTAAAVRGESSTAYSAYPWSAAVPERVFSVVPDAKLVYLVREPLTRIRSHIAQNLWDGLPVLPFESLMADLENPRNIPVWCSRYATQLRQWLAYFPREQLLVVDQQDLEERRTTTIQGVVRFLGVDANFTDRTWELEHNQSTSHRVPRNRVMRWGRAGRWALATPLRPLLTRPIEVPQFSSDDRRRLMDLLQPEIRDLEKLTGRSFSHWVDRDS